MCKSVRLSKIRSARKDNWKISANNQLDENYGKYKKRTLPANSFLLDSPWWGTALWSSPRNPVFRISGSRVGRLRHRCLVRAGAAHLQGHSWQMTHTDASTFHFCTSCCIHLRALVFTPQIINPHRFFIYITSYFTAILSCLRHTILISLQSVHSRVTTCVQRYESCLVTNSILFCWLVTIKHQCKKIFL